MATLNLVQLIELSEQNKTKDAAKLVSEYFEALTPAERGKAYLDLGTVYLQMVASNQTKLAAILEDQINQLKALEKAEKAVLDDLDLQQVRNQLGK